MIFVDTGALYALVDRNDVNHAAAKKYYSDVLMNETLCISLPVLTESCLLVDARLGNHFANKLLESVTKGIFEILDITLSDLSTALQIEKKYHKASFGFVDATCFALCEKHKISTVFTYDRKHFGLYRPKFTGSLKLVP